MYINPFQVSLETLIGAAPLLGHALEDRSDVRQAQDLHLVQRLQQGSTCPLRSASQGDLFCVAPLDILVTEENGQKRFHLIELNGTGIGGLTNLSANAVSAVLESLYQMAHRLPHDDAVVLVASSGQEMPRSPRFNKLIHEKILYAEALKRGFESTGRVPVVHSIPHAMKQSAPFPAGRPAIVLGYMKEFLASLELGGDGRLYLFGRPVHAAINDRFCLNVVHHFQHQVDLSQWWTLNRGFLAGADKGVVYALLNEFVASRADGSLPLPGSEDGTRGALAFDRVRFVRASERDHLVATVLDWVRSGRKALIKPQGTGLGHGIRFFLSGEERDADIITRIDDSLRETEELYGLRGGALPYTVCEFLDTCTIQRDHHTLRGHKFELRIVVYRDGGWLKAFPSITKIASEAYDAARPAHLSLINNITTSAQAKHTAGVEFMMPLSRRETVDTLGLTVADLERVCATSTRFVRYLLDTLEDRPRVLGLPDSHALALATDLSLSGVPLS